MTRRRKFALLLLVAAGLFWLPPLPAELSLESGNSPTLLDRHGRPLRQLLGAHEGVNTFVKLKSMPPLLVEAFLVSEDRRFFWHPGVDPAAVTRALWTNLRSGERVSGGSSITQQLVRNLLGHHHRNWKNKLLESYYAVRLEAVTRKSELLEHYLNRVPFGNQLYGVEAAARGYFGRPVAELSLKQSAALAVLVRSPSTLDPNFEGQRQDLAELANALIDRMYQQGSIGRERWQIAKDEQLILDPDPDRFLAAHFCDWLLSQGQKTRTTLDLDLQREIEELVSSHLRRLSHKQVSQAAVVVLEVESGDVLAMIGSRDYFDFTRDGQVNAVLSPRQPGSTLKPFTYGLAIEQGWSGGTLLPDLDLYPSDRGESFIPKNYDERYHGPVSLRQSLGCSYNVPAVRALEMVGVEALLERLRSLGMQHLAREPEYYGLGLTLGDGEVTLLELANAYRALARGGQWSAVRGCLDDPLPRSEAVMDPVAAYLITDILADDRARLQAFGTPNALEFPFPVAVKTGTSKGFRDNWTVGYTPKHVVAVWAGNFDGRPMVEVSGLTGAGPLFHEVMALVGDGGDFAAPEGVKSEKVCAISGLLPNEVCPHKKRELFDERFPVQDRCTVHRRLSVDLRTGYQAQPSTPAHYLKEKTYTVYEPLYRNWMVESGHELPPEPALTGHSIRIAFPQNESIFKRDPVLRKEHQCIVFKAVVAEQVDRIEWWVDGRREGITKHPRFSWQLRPGYHQIEVRANGHKSRPVRIRVY